MSRRPRTPAEIEADEAAEAEAFARDMAGILTCLVSIAEDTERVECYGCGLVGWAALPCKGCLERLRTARAARTQKVRVE